MKDNEHPFFRPLWRRVAIVAACALWAILEFVNGSHLWGLGALAFAGYGVWQFFVRYDPPPQDPPAGKA